MTTRWTRRCGRGRSPPWTSRRGLSSTFLARQAETVGTDAFAREYLCRTVWSQTRRVITADAWSELPHGQVDIADVVVAVEVDADRTGAAVVAAGPHDDLVAVKVLEAAGRGGLGARLRRRARARRRWSSTSTGPPPPSSPPSSSSPSGPQGQSSHDVADAAAGLVDAVAARRIGHTGDPRFQDAVTWLARRQRGDRWVFDRTRGDVVHHRRRLPRRLAARHPPRRRPNQPPSTDHRW